MAALLLALRENINMFYPPDEVASGIAPKLRNIRAGGMVAEGTVQRDSQSLAVNFVLTDRQGSDFVVSYTGILPDLFREGQGLLVEGQIQEDGTFLAHEVLAKHDENYMPPELMDIAAEADQGGTKSRSSMPEDEL